MQDSDSPPEESLVLPAIVATQHNPVIKAVSERLRERGKCPMQIIGAAMRKLIHIAFGVLKSGKPFDPNYGGLEWILYK
jgi:hypothetical protein